MCVLFSLCCCVQLGVVIRFISPIVREEAIALFSRFYTGGVLCLLTFEMA